MPKQDLPLAGVLIVDGEVLVRHAIADYLRHCGYTVFEAASTDEALIVLGEETLRVDAVLCDAQAPGAINAFVLRHHLPESANPQARFILAGSIEVAAQGAADLCEEGPHLARPYDPQGVVDHIRRLIGLGGQGG